MLQTLGDEVLTLDRTVIYSPQLNPKLNHETNDS